MEFHLFAGPEDLGEFLREIRRNAARDVERLSDDVLLANDPATLAESIVSRYRKDQLTGDLDAARVREMQIRTVSTRYEGQEPPLQIALCLPVTGEEGFWALRTAGLMFNPRCRFKDGLLCVEMRPGGTKEEIEREIARIKEGLRAKFGDAASVIDGHNRDLEARIPKLVEQRRQQVAKKREMLGSLSVPFERNPNAPSTFAVPLQSTRKEVKVERAPSGASQLAPVLTQQAFLEVVKTIHDFGAAVERHPSIYRGKDEEHLRDLLLLILAANFKGPVSATGEALNAAGKTDILLRYEGSNIFIAECLIWKGSTYFDEKIEQLSTYLTWRDTKAALVVFAKTKAIEPVIAKARERLEKHPRFVRWDSTSGGAAVAVMQFPGDAARVIFVALLVFHFPEDTPPGESS